jgi:hypothetical protein
VRYQFRHQVIDTDLPGQFYAQTALPDLDGDERLEFIVGRRYGEICWYKCHAPNRWSRHPLGEESPSDAGGCAVDVDGDGRVDFVTGGAWYRNSQDPDRPFERFLFDPALEGVHDLVAADVDGDGRLEIVTMSDRSNLRSYKIPDVPTGLWPRHDIGPAVHAGVSVGDLDGDGHLDIVRTDVWFENVNGDGTEWTQHRIGPSSPPPPDFRPPFAFNATYSVVCDMNGNGRSDVVFTDGEIPGAKIWWMENCDGGGRHWERHDVPNGDDVRRGAYHSLFVGDLDGDGDWDIFSCEMEAVPGDRPPRWYIWENLDGKGERWREHVVLDANLGGHDAVVGDITGNGLPDILAKPWSPRQNNAVGGKMFIVFLENVSGKRLAEPGADPEGEA